MIFELPVWNLGRKPELEILGLGVKVSTGCHDSRLDRSGRTWLMRIENGY